MDGRVVVKAILRIAYSNQKHVPGWVGGWVDGCMEGSKSCFKDYLQQLKTQ